MCHLVDALVKRVNDRRRQGLGDIADAESNEIRIRMRFAVLPNPSTNFGKEVSSSEFEVVIVDSSHGVCL